jgi:cyclin D5
MDDSLSLSSLICQESEICLDEEVVKEDSFINFKNYDGSEDENLEMLFEREICSGFKRDESLVFGNWVKCARLEAITWILKVSLTPTIFFFFFFIELD